MGVACPPFPESLCSEEGMAKRPLCLGTVLALKSCPNLVLARNLNWSAFANWLGGILYDVPFHKDMQHVKHGETSHCVWVHTLVLLSELLLRSLPVSVEVLNIETWCHTSESLPKRALLQEI